MHLESKQFRIVNALYGIMWVHMVKKGILYQCHCSNVGAILILIHQISRFGGQFRMKKMQSL